LPAHTEQPAALLALPAALRQNLLQNAATSGAAGPVNGRVYGGITPKLIVACEGHTDGRQFRFAHRAD
jgi:hypothetical protein